MTAYKLRTLQPTARPSEWRTIVAAPTVPVAVPGRPTSRIAQLLESPEPFIRYLRTFSPGEPVGTPNQLCGCPLSAFLAYKGVREPVMVGPTTVRWAVNSVPSPRMAPRYLLPPWALTFVFWIDRGPQRPITAGEALALLERIARMELAA